MDGSMVMSYWLAQLAVAWWFLPPAMLPVTLVGVSVNATVPAQSLAILRCPGSGDTAMVRPGQRACAIVDVVSVRDRAVLVPHRTSPSLQTARV